MNSVLIIKWWGHMLIIKVCNLTPAVLKKSNLLNGFAACTNPTWALHTVRKSWLDHQPMMIHAFTAVSFSLKMQNSVKPRGVLRCENSASGSVRCFHRLLLVVRGLKLRYWKHGRLQWGAPNDSEKNPSLAISSTGAPHTVWCFYNRNRVRPPRTKWAPFHLGELWRVS